jgi:triphosphoribosyl-dephospho-CoA synthetase
VIAIDFFCRKLAITERSRHIREAVRETEATSSDSAHLPGVILLTRQRRVAAGSGLSTGLSTTAKYVRRTESGTAGKNLGATIKCLRRTWNGAAGSGLGTTIKYL